MTFKRDNRTGDKAKGDKEKARTPAVGILALSFVV
jgi:hypothetical protein